MNTLLILSPARQTKRTLRIFMSHSVQNQAWQKEAGLGKPPGNELQADGTIGSLDGGNASFETGDGVPSWTFKIEGKLLQVTNRPLANFLN